MTAWSYVALAGILCTTITVCWGLWLNAIYRAEEGVIISGASYQRTSDPSEANTMVWPQEKEG